MSFNKAVAAVVLAFAVACFAIVMSQVMHHPKVLPHHEDGPYTTEPHTIPPGIDPTTPITGLPGLNVSPLGEDPTTVPPSTIVIAPIGSDGQDYPRPPRTTTTLPPVTVPPIALPPIVPPIVIPPVTIDPDGLTDAVCKNLPALCGIVPILDNTVTGVTSTVDDLGGTLTG